MKRSHLVAFFLGVVFLLVAKYLIVGLDRWNATFHPGRTEPADSPFRRPLLGLV